MKDKILHDQGLKVWEAYAGAEAVSAFLSSFAPINPALAERTIAHAYGEVMGDPTLTYLQKSGIIVTTLTTEALDPPALALHTNAFIRQSKMAGLNDTEIQNDIDQIKRLVAIDDSSASVGWSAEGKTLRSAFIEAAQKTNGENSSKTLVLRGIASLAARGNPAKAQLVDMLDFAIDRGIKSNEINAVFNTVAIYAGYPRAICASRVFAELQNNKQSVTEQLSL